VNTPKIDAYAFLKKVREQKPIVHHLTNWVTIYDCANIVKAFGASPVMAHAPEEAAQMSSIASSLVLNIGTLTADFVEAMKLAAKSANRKGIPIILDACGAGATEFRDRKSFELLDQVKIAVIKGNVSEICRLAGKNVATKGVDAGLVEEDLEKIATALAKERKAIVVITGKSDIVADANNLCRVNNGVEMLTHVVGTGCMAASVIGTFCAVSKDLLGASAAGLSCFGIAAELAAKQSRGPASFKEKLFDCVFNLSRQSVEKKQKIEFFPRLVVEWERT